MKSLLNITDDERAVIEKAICEIKGVGFVGIGWLKQDGYTHIFWVENIPIEYDFDQNNDVRFFNEKENEFLRYILFPIAAHNSARSAFDTNRKYQMLIELGYDMDYRSYPGRIFWNKD